MKKFVFVGFFSAVFAVSFAAQADVLDCQGAREFFGGVEQIRSGECAGRWAIRTNNELIIPTNMPASFAREGSPVYGCFVPARAQGCEADGATASFVNLKRITPAYED